ncbi:MAG: class II fructose-bisphosphate aldolase, partial [Peptococcaceae bacterium]|nr:class II fructose-bisphosphate aldolase [Peptococcaceae bacterium]
FKPGQKPMLRFDILEEIERRVPNFPIVLHGASSVSQEYVRIIQANGGSLADAIGIPEDMLRQAAKSAVCKINIDSDLRLAMTAGVREALVAKPEAFDPREYLKVGRANVKALVAHKIQNVLGSEGKAL